MENGLENGLENDDENTETSPREFLEQLTIGNPAFSPRDRQRFALAEYVPLAECIKAGDATAFNDFARKATALLAIEREIHGSQVGYFDRLAEVTALTKAAMENGTNATDSVGGWTDASMQEWWINKGHTNGKAARTEFMKQPGSSGMTQSFEAAWKKAHPTARRGRPKNPT